MRKYRNAIYSTIIFIFMSICGTILGSPQLPDYIVYNGDTLAIYNLILEKYFEKTNRSDQGSLFGLKFRDGASVNCWRGYQAIYQIENDSLFLCHIISCGELLYKSSIDIKGSNERLLEIFNDRVINGKVFIFWYSDNISLPKGKLLRWDGVFYKSFEKEILIKINKGIVTETLEIENYVDDPFKINRRYNDSIPNVLFEQLERLSWRNLDKCDCSEKYLITINEKGKVSKVMMANYLTKKEIKESWDRYEYNYCIRTIYKGLKKLKFDIIKQDGKNVAENVYIEIWFDLKTRQLENWTY